MRLCALCLFLTFSPTLLGNPPSILLQEEDPRLADAFSILSLNPGWSLLRCEGDSMKPYFGDNDLIIVEAIAFEALRLGMIIVYRDAAGDRVAHQVVGEKNGQFRAGGVSNNTSDQTLVTKENFLGSVVAILRADKETRHPLTASLARLPVAHGKKN